MLPDRDLDDLLAVMVDRHEKLASRIADLERNENTPGPFVHVRNYGAKGDGITDDTTSIQAAIDTAKITGYGQINPGRIVVQFNPGDRYIISSPLDLCGLQGVTLDGGSARMGAVIHAKCTGKAAFEIIGSRDIDLRNMEVWGDIADTPSMAFWTSRSNTVPGFNSSMITFHNIFVYGYFTKCVYYGLDTENNHFYDSVLMTYGGGLDAIAYLASVNDLALTPDNATLLGAGYGNALLHFMNCHLIMDGAVTTARALYIRGYGEVTLRNCYLYSPTQPTIEMDGSIVLAGDGVSIEGSPAKTLQITYRAGFPNTHSLVLRKFGFGQPTTYSIYADNNTALQNSSFISCIPGISGGAYKPVRLYTAEFCDFSGLCVNDAVAFDITFDTGHAYFSTFHLGTNDTITYLNAAFGYANITNDDSAGPGYLSMDGGKGLKLASAQWDHSHIVMGAYHLWVDSTGDLRIKSGAPGSDLDGTVVGSQS